MSVPTSASCAFVFPDGAFGLSEDEAMFSEDEDGEGLFAGQDPQSQLPTPAAEKLLCLNRLAGHSNHWHHHRLFLYKLGHAFALLSVTIVFMWFGMAGSCFMWKKKLIKHLIDL